MLPRRVLLNLVLLCAAGALALVVVLDRPERAAVEARLTAIDPALVSTIRIERAASEPVEFERTDGTWYMTVPTHMRAHPARINGILALLHEPVHARLPADSLQRFGLDQPEAVVHLDGHRFAFGTTNPLDERRYLLYGDVVHLVNDSLFFQLGQDPGFFMDNSLLPDGARPLRIVYPARTLIRVDGVWRSDPETGLGTDALRAAAAAWETARAVAVRILNEAPPEAAVSVETDQGSTISFELLPAPPGVILARRDLGIQYHLDSFTAKALLLTDEPDASQVDSEK